MWEKCRFKQNPLFSAIPTSPTKSLYNFMQTHLSNKPIQTSIYIITQHAPHPFFIESALSCTLLCATLALSAADCARLIFCCA